MVIKLRSRMLSLAMAKRQYRYSDLPAKKTQGPFCISIKIPGKISNPDAFLQRLTGEIRSSELAGSPYGIAFKGRPDDLNLDRIHTLVQTLSEKVSSHRMAIEVDPSTVTTDYLGGLAHLGFSRVCFLLGSFSKKEIEVGTLARRVFESGKLGMDTSVVLDGTSEELIRDCVTLLQARPKQVTIFPSEKTRPLILERAARIFSDAGYVRRGPWTFSVDRNVDLYEPFREPLGMDLFGFGSDAGSFARDGWFFNPPLSLYLVDTTKGLVQTKRDPGVRWHRIARMLGALEFSVDRSWPLDSRIIGRCLRAGGYVIRGKIMNRGIRLAGFLLERLGEPFPEKIVNHQDFRAAVAESGGGE